MTPELFHPASSGRAMSFVFSNLTETCRGAEFQALPINLSADEIREMVLEVMG